MVGAFIFPEWKRIPLKRCFRDFSEKQTILLLKLAEVLKLPLTLRLKGSESSIPWPSSSAQGLYQLCLRKCGSAAQRGKLQRNSKCWFHLKQSGRVQKEVLDNPACQTISGYLQQAAGIYMPGLSWHTCCEGKFSLPASWCSLASWQMYWMVERGTFPSMQTRGAWHRFSLNWDT